MRFETVTGVMVGPKIWCRLCAFLYRSVRKACAGLCTRATTSTWQATFQANIRPVAMGFAVPRERTGMLLLYCLGRTYCSSTSGGTEFRSNDVVSPKASAEAPVAAVVEDRRKTGCDGRKQGLRIFIQNRKTLSTLGTLLTARPMGPPCLAPACFYSHDAARLALAK
ncbi:hypothetical protein BD289DRAFT_225531 [Coniella lustricola]|uniref:Uncharacterized protein n=1 Tax=Coniella lustricola TaxID=2025994 RepID=A0A2T3AAV6_9PEZI|nr:hypothetical protein BD289DRAFT_225531 [Coniella lustricola]